MGNVDAAIRLYETILGIQVVSQGVTVVRSQRKPGTSRVLAIRMTPRSACDRAVFVPAQGSPGGA
jgi:hypothetical protein